jgi:hypothetical protein
MRLITAHRILIGAAIAFFVFFAAVQLRLYLRVASAAALIEAIVSVAVAVGLGVYYRSLARRWDRPS